MKIDKENCIECNYHKAILRKSPLNDYYCIECFEICKADYLNDYKQDNKLKGEK